MNSTVSLKAIKTLTTFDQHFWEICSVVYNKALLDLHNCYYYKTCIIVQMFYLK